MNENSLPIVRESLDIAVRQASDMHGRMTEILPSLSAIAEACALALRNGRTIFFCGNGGSAAESQHLATEFVVRLSAKRNRGALSSIALTTDTSLLTACANDFGFDRIFARQVEAHIHAGDVLILLSTSGESPDLLEAAHTARDKQGVVIGFLGAKQSSLDALCQFALHIPSPHSQRVQEAHLMCGHLLVESVESLLYDKPSSESGTHR